MTALNLEAIRKRAEWITDNFWMPGEATILTRVDIPALITEVHRLEWVVAAVDSLHHEKRGREAVSANTGGDVEWREYVICDYDKTPWPCRTHTLLHRDTSNTGGEQ